MAIKNILYNPILWIVAVGIVLYVIYVSTSGNSLSCGVNGMTEIRCIDGYKFTVSNDGNTRQVLDEFGKGARCK